MNPFFEDLQQRDLVKQVTDDHLINFIGKESRTLYCGFDPTSDSLHIGSLLPILTLKRFQNAGHRPLALVGGATGMIGDPTGKSQERALLDPSALQKNVEGITRILSRFLDFSGPHAAKVVNNADWFQGVSYLEFLRDVGKHFTVNYMMAKDSVRARLEDREHGISYTEFSYMLLQAFDFYHLHQKENCTLQVGGSDQWGNITAGCELIRRMSAAHGKKAPEVFGLTHPLVLKSDGSKFGKTETGTIWLDEEKTSPYQFFQFLLQTADADVIRLLKYFSFRPMEEIQELEKSVLTVPEKREAQKALAEEITTLIHGKDAVVSAEKASQALFSAEVKNLDQKTLLSIFADTPSTRKTKNDLGISLLDLLVETQLCKSKGAARKDIESGGIYMNNERASDISLTVRGENLIDGQFLLLRKGKKNYHLVSFQ